MQSDHWSHEGVTIALMKGVTPGFVQSVCWPFVQNVRCKARTSWRGRQPRKCQPELPKAHTVGCTIKSAHRRLHNQKRTPQVAQSKVLTGRIKSTQASTQSKAQTSRCTTQCKNQLVVEQAHTQGGCYRVR